MLRAKFANMVGAIIQIPPYQFPNFKFFYPHVKKSVCLLIPKIPPKRWSIFSTYRIDIWLLTGACHILCACVLLIAGIPAPYLQVVQTFITGSFPEDCNSKVGRNVLLVTSFFGLVFFSALSGRFVSILSSPREQPQIDTLEEANKILTAVYSAPAYLAYFEDLDKSDVVWKLLNKRVGRINGPLNHSETDVVGYIGEKDYMEMHEVKNREKHANHSGTEK